MVDWGRGGRRGWTGRERGAGGRGWVIGGSGVRVRGGGGKKWVGDESYRGDGGGRTWRGDE